MKKSVQSVLVLSVVALFSLSLSTPSFAEWHHEYHYHHEPDAGDGFLAGLASALATSYSFLTTAESEQYDADTLADAAALFRAGQDNALFEQFVDSMSVQMANQMGANFNKVDGSVLRSMIADKILKSAK